MNPQQVVWPEKGLWMGVDRGTVWLSRGRGVQSVAAAALTPLLGPGPSGCRMLWLGADEALHALGEGQPLVAAVCACDSDPRLLCIARRAGSLVLESSCSATSVSLPALPLDVAVLGGSGPEPHRVLLALPGGLWLLRWGELEGRLDACELLGDTVQAVAFLPGTPAVAVARQVGGSHDRLLIWHVDPGPWQTPMPLPPLALLPEVPTALRPESRGLLALAGSGGWLRWSADAWRLEPDLPPPDGVPTRVHGQCGAFDLQPLDHKKLLPPISKLPVSGLSARPPERFSPR